MKSENISVIPAPFSEDATHILPGVTAQLFASKRHDVCIIVGVLNEGERIRQQLLTMQPYKNMVDIFIADGGSTDGALSQEYVQDKMRGLIVCAQSKSGLSGQYGAAMQFAMSEGYQGIIMVDGNGKDGMDAIPRFLGALREGYDFVQGSRFMLGGQHKNTPIDRMLGIRFIFNPIMNFASGYHFTDAINGFKAVSRRYLLDKKLQPFHDRYYCYGLQYYLTCSALKLGYRVIEIPVVREYPEGKPAPTKIRGLPGRILIIWELCRMMMGAYSPLKD